MKEECDLPEGPWGNVRSYCAAPNTNMCQATLCWTQPKLLMDFFFFF